jgi:hypothetical protein
MDKIKLITRSDSLHYLQYYNVCTGLYECVPRRGFSGAASDSWEWNGSTKAPSLAPSIRHIGGKGWHYYIENGRIRYLGDGPTGPEELVVDMVPIDEVGACYVVIWTVYANPSDYPGKWVVRRWILDTPGTWCFVAPSLEMARRVLPGHLTRLERWPTDDPCIVECWI